ncbi:MAG: ECF transporter S component [Candidatus Thermoplasmatota archaeon]|nr:ECF transporter S component [Candidatus Thermoplasmatota archaeon]
MSSGGEGEGGGSPAAPRNPAKFVSPKTVALYGILTALTTAVTMVLVVPFPPTRGFFNLGDAMVFFSALTFGMRAGAICGGIGSAIADVLLGFGYFAPITLVAKGSEGLVAGAIGRIKAGAPAAKLLGVAAGSLCMVSTYFFSEWVLYGIGPAIAEVPVNVAQVLIGGSIGILLSVPVSNLLRTAGRPHQER